MTWVASTPLSDADRWEIRPWASGAISDSVANCIDGWYDTLGSFSGGTIYPRLLSAHESTPEECRRCPPTW